MLSPPGAAVGGNLFGWDELPLVPRRVVRVTGRATIFLICTSVRVLESLSAYRKWGIGPGLFGWPVMRLDMSDVSHDDFFLPLWLS